jgi:hypothetical protein
MAGWGGRGRSGAATAARPAARPVAATATNGSSGVVLPNGVTMRELPNGTRDYRFTQGSDQVTFNVFSQDSRGSEVGFFVNGSISREAATGTPADRVRTALRVNQIMRADVASRPDGFRYYTSAATGDGAGADRVRLYARAGFSTPDRVGGLQAGVVRNGVLTPLDPAAILPSRQARRDSLREAMAAIGMPNQIGNN